jgi:hypothetical protein
MLKFDLKTVKLVIRNYTKEIHTTETIIYPKNKRDFM